MKKALSWYSTSPIPPPLFIYVSHLQVKSHSSGQNSNISCFLFCVRKQVCFVGQSLPLLLLPHLLQAILVSSQPLVYLSHLILLAWRKIYSLVLTPSLQVIPIRVSKVFISIHICSHHCSKSVFQGFSLQHPTSLYSFFIFLPSFSPRSPHNNPVFKWFTSDLPETNFFVHQSMLSYFFLSFSLDFGLSFLIFIPGSQSVLEYPALF